MGSVAAVELTDVMEEAKAVRTPVRIKIQRLEAGGGEMTMSGKKKNKRKREEIVLDTGQKKIVDFILKRANADLIRESHNNKNQRQGAGHSPLSGFLGHCLSELPSSTTRDADPYLV